MTPSVRVCLMLVLCGASLAAQQGQRTPALELGLSAGAAHGREVGTGATLDLDARWQPRRTRWLAIVGTVSATQFGRTRASTSTADLWPFLSSPATFSDFSVSASSLSATLGPEVSLPGSRVRPYLHVLGGVSRVRFGGDYLWLRARDATGQYVIANDFGPSAIERRHDNAATVVVGSGVHMPLTHRIALDIGARYTAVRPITWITTGIATQAGVTPVGDPFATTYDYRRSLSAWSARIGLRAAP